jgi:hypothetical protein
MKRSRHSEEKIIAAVKQMEGGRKTSRSGPRTGRERSDVVRLEEQVRGDAGE